jgi:N-acetylglucosamine malate deacetylase 1
VTCTPARPCITVRALRFLEQSIGTKMNSKTLLVGLAHPDDEVGAAGTIAAHRALGHRVVIVWLTRGEMTEAFGPLPEGEVAARREEQGAKAGEILGAETEFLDFTDTGLVATPDAAAEVARVMARLRPDAVLTWGDAWVRGMRHPDHQACGKIFRDAITLARIAKIVRPLSPHRAAVPVFTLRDTHSSLPAVAMDVEAHLDTIYELGEFYTQGIGFGDREWLTRRLRRAGTRHDLAYAEEFDAWETAGGTVASLFDASPLEDLVHPERRRPADG